jgi:hypothetical protein
MSSISADVVGAAGTDAGRGWLRLWRDTHFTGFTRREAWGYGLWLFFGVIVAVPEIWAAAWAGSAPFPTISATTGALEYEHPWVALIVAGTVVLCLYSALRYPVDRTGMLARRGRDGEALGGANFGDALLPYRTPGGGRLTRSTTPVREIGAAVYFSAAIGVIAVCTAVAAIATDPNDEYPVGRTLYGLILVFWVLVPNVFAWPKRFAVDVPFPTLFATVRSLERRVRVLALLAAACLVILLLHLVLYPWPSIIPDLNRTHRTYACHPVQPAERVLTQAQQAACKRLDEANGKPEPVAP